MRLLKSVLVPVHPQGWPFVGLFALAAAVLWYVALPLGLVGCVLTLWCVYFFRNPDRTTPTRPGLVISPADGVVQMITSVPPPDQLDMGQDGLVRVSIFMNVFDVHVNRVPVDGVVDKVFYYPGRFVNASLDKASEHNERQCVAVRTADGRRVAFVQIAGLIARRILCNLQPGQSVRAGERFGMIRFGSRVDVFLPAGVQAMVAVGQRAVAGETVIADMNSSEPQRAGEVR
ncbi:MAG: phosphatidylserine decarboxylase [Alphaproteobacteria bacterium]|nr:phosphatidylserine decarboxylase [Alphaproteobacteria bacterium]